MMRERLTITLRKDILDAVDRVIDGTQIRNRSHAIEYLIEKASTPGIRRVLILAGGAGTKARTLTPEIPKGMLPVDGRPLLEQTINLCRHHEIRDIYLSIGPEGKPIEHYFGDGSRFGVRITYLKQSKSNVGTAPSLSQARDVMGNEPFLVLYGDVLADINLTDLLDFHITSGNVATMALTSTAIASDWGVVTLHGSIITDFIEKPSSGSTYSYVINAGMFVFQPEIFDYIPAKSKKLEQDVFPRLAREHKLSGYLFDGRWYDVGSTKMYHKATKERVRH